MKSEGDTDAPCAPRSCLCEHYDKYYSKTCSIEQVSHSQFSLNCLSSSFGMLFSVLVVLRKEHLGQSISAPVRSLIIQSTNPFPLAPAMLHALNPKLVSYFFWNKKTLYSQTGATVNHDMWYIVASIVRWLPSSMWLVTYIIRRTLLFWTVVWSFCHLELKCSFLSSC